MLLSFIQLLILLVLVVIFMAVTLAFIPKIIVKSAPKDIQEKVLARPDNPKWKTVTGIVLAVIILLSILGLFTWAGKDAVDENMSFWMILARFLILFEGFKIFDMICFDWLLLTKLNIFQKFFPETIGCKGYESFGFNLKSQITKIVIYAILSTVIALILANQ